MNIKLHYQGADIKSIKFYKNGKVKREKYYDGTIAEYDERGNRIHSKYPNSYEWWKEYDGNNNEIHYKNSRGYEQWYGYDERGNCVYRKFNDKVTFDKRKNKGE